MPRPNPLKVDPTRTKMQRVQLQRDMNRRFSSLKREITKLLVDEDVFGMSKKSTGNQQTTTNTLWQFLTSSQQLTEFTSWLRQQVALTILARVQQTGELTEDHWLREHIETVYRRGMLKAFDSIKKPILQENLDFYDGTREQFLRSSFAKPVSVERVKLLAGRAFNDLEGITNTMSTQMGRTLTDGFIQGNSPREIAKQLNKDVDKLGRKRSEMIAQTEVVRAHNEGQLTAIEDLGVEDVGVAVEWSTSGLGITARGNASPCPLCRPLDGVVLKISEARGMLPRHPYCRCSWVPGNVGEIGKGQKKTKGRIQEAIKRSISAERPKKKKHSVKQQRKLTKWVGKSRRISKKRPESLL